MRVPEMLTPLAGGARDERLSPAKTSSPAGKKKSTSKSKGKKKASGTTRNSRTNSASSTQRARRSRPAQGSRPADRAGVSREARRGERPNAGASNLTQGLGQTFGGRSEVTRPLAGGAVDPRLTPPSARTPEHLTPLGNGERDPRHQAPAAPPSAPPVDNNIDPGTGLPRGTIVAA